MDPNYLFRKKFLKDVEDYRKTYGAFDHILVSGDIAFKGIKEEYDAAYKFFEKLCDKSGCKPEEIYVVPGNHDKNFNTPNAELRHLIDAGLANEDVDSDKLFVELLKNDFTQFKTMYQPFKDYQDFAIKMVSLDPLMTKCLEKGNCEPYQNETDKAYMTAHIGTLSDYPVILYAMNTALNSDWNDVNDFGKGHKLFLPKLSYNIHEENEGCINIVMMHHPISNLTNGIQIANVLDSFSQIQIFGHLHKPASHKNECIYIHSGALQPPKSDNDNSEEYFSVYNILELDVTTKDGENSLRVQLKVEKYDENKNSFVEMERESRDLYLPLKQHVSRWCQETEQTSLPDGITERTVKYEFLRRPDLKTIINRMSPYCYDKDKSLNVNCVNFLNQMQAEHRMAELWRELNLK